MNVYKMVEIEKMLNPIIGENRYKKLRGNRHYCVPIDDKGYLIQLNYYKLDDNSKNAKEIVIYCDTENLLIFSDDEECYLKSKEVMNEKLPLLQLHAFFFTLTSDDIGDLEQVEDEIEALEDMIIRDGKTSKDILGKISTMRRELLLLKKFYEQLSFIIDEIIDNEIIRTNKDVLKEEIQQRVNRLSNRLNVLMMFVQELRDMANQLREAYQAQIDTEQNKLMKYFTVISTIFLPLTVIVGWYGMNFSMPEYQWNMGYVYVIVLSIVVCLGSYLYFKYRKWF